MIYSADDISIALVKPQDALQLNKMLVSNTDRFLEHLPKTLADNSTFGATQKYIKRKIKAAENKTEYVFIIHDQNSSNIVGMVILKHLDWELKQGEFAYCIGKRYKGKELMSTALTVLTNYTLDVMGLETLRIIAHKTNLSSVNTAIRAGFQWHGTLKNEFIPLIGGAVDMELFEFSRTDID